MKCAIIIFNMNEVPGRPAEARRTSRLAVTAFVIGIASLVNFLVFPPDVVCTSPVLDNAFFAFPGAVACALSITAIKKIRGSAGLKGMYYAAAGLVLGLAALMFPLGDIIIIVLYSL